MKYQNMLQLVGKTPCVRILASEISIANLYIKLESFNPTGSIKDRACVYLLNNAKKKGKFQPGMTLLDASSGNMGCALAFYGHMMGYPTMVISSSKLTKDKRSFMEYFGATVHQTGDFTIEGNHYCRELLKQETSETFCFLDQLHNWENPKAHYETTGPEILSEFPNVAMVVGSLGSGGSLVGTGIFLKEQRKDIKIIAVQAASGTRLPGTGSFVDGDYVTPFIQKGIDDHLFDDMISITEEDARRRTRQLKHEGIFCGLQSGGVSHAALLAIEKFAITGDVVMLSGDSGWKNMDKLLSINSS